MKNKTLLNIGIIALFIILCSCNNNDKIIETVKESFQKEMDTAPNFREYGIKVTDVFVIKKDSKNYDGYVTISIQGDTHKVPITISKNKGDILWKSEPLAFVFLLRY